MRDDLIKYVFEDIIRLGCKFAILGSGEKIYEDFFSEMHYRYPDSIKAGPLQKTFRRKAQCRIPFYATVHPPDNSGLKIDLAVVFYLLAVL